MAWGRRSQTFARRLRFLKVMSQEHCLECPAWSELRKGLDVTNIIGLVVFFRRLLTERARLEEKGVTETASHNSM
jgi:hypothetical protein